MICKQIALVPVCDVASAHLLM